MGEIYPCCSNRKNSPYKKTIGSFFSLNFVSKFFYFGQHTFLERLRVINKQIYFWNGRFANREKFVKKYLLRFFLFRKKKFPASRKTTIGETWKFPLDDETPHIKKRLGVFSRWTLCNLLLPTRLKAIHKSGFVVGKSKDKQINFFFWATPLKLFSTTERCRR